MKKFGVFMNKKNVQFLFTLIIFVLFTSFLSSTPQLLLRTNIKIDRESINSNKNLKDNNLRDFSSFQKVGVKIPLSRIHLLFHQT